MFFNLNAEMGRAKLTIKKLSEITAINYESAGIDLGEDSRKDRVFTKSGLSETLYQGYIFEKM